MLSRGRHRVQPSRMNGTAPTRQASEKAPTLGGGQSRGGEGGGKRKKSEEKGDKDEAGAAEIDKGNGVYHEERRWYGATGIRNRRPS